MGLGHVTGVWARTVGKGGGEVCDEFLGLRGDGVDMVVFGTVVVLASWRNEQILCSMLSRYGESVAMQCFICSSNIFVKG